MRPAIVLAIVIVCLVTLWIGSGVIFPTSDVGENAEKSSVQENQKYLADVRVRKSQSDTYVNSIEITGLSQASKKLEIKSQTTGKIESLIHQEGDFVNKGEIIAKLEIEDRKVAVDEAKELVRQREIEFNAARKLENQGFNSKIKLAQAETALESAKLSLDRAELELNRTIIKAPIDGVLDNQSVEEGKYIITGGTLFSQVSLDPLEFEAFATESDVQTINLGQSVQITLLDGREIEGEIIFISPVADPKTRTFRILASINNPKMDIREGMTATINIPSKEKPAHKISPSFLTLNDQGKVGVKIVDKDNIVRFIPVKILSDSQDFMMISGLPDTVDLITVGQEFVIEGQKVNPVYGKSGGLL